MATRSNFATEKSYRDYKAREYDRYYRSTQLYDRRAWEQEDINTLISNIGMPVLKLSALIHRSAKAIEHEKRRLRRAGIL